MQDDAASISHPKRSFEGLAQPDAASISHPKRSFEGLAQPEITREKKAASSSVI